MITKFINNTIPWIHIQAQEISEEIGRSENGVSQA